MSRSRAKARKLAARFVPSLATRVIRRLEAQGVEISPARRRWLVTNFREPLNAERHQRVMRELYAKPLILQTEQDLNRDLAALRIQARFNLTPVRPESFVYVTGASS